MQNIFSKFISKNAFSKLLAKATFFLLLLFILDFVVGGSLRYFYFKQDSGLQFRTTYALEKTKDDILILGASRANHHYDPTIIESSLAGSCYNAGRDGNNIIYHTAMLTGILKRYKPKMVILDFSRAEFELKQDSYDKLSSLLPYYATHPELRAFIRLKSEFERYKLCSQTYPFNSSLFTIVAGNLNFNKKRILETKGYLPLLKVLDHNPKTPILKQEQKTDSILINTFEALITICKNDSVELFVICSPYFFNANQIDKSIQTAKEIAQKNNITFLDYSNDPAFISNTAYFSDDVHLNKQGAEAFTKKTADSILFLLKQK